MFLDFYRLREQPFGVTPDPRFLYFSPTHREALASLYCGVETECGFMAMVAPPGVGKTTLLFHLLERLGASARTVFLFQTQCDARELLRYVLADLQLETRQKGIVEMHGQLNELLAQEVRAGRRFVLVIDEAQNLKENVLETIRLLSNFETPKNKLMQIILSGQPQMAAKLAQPGLVQLRQRLSVLTRLDPLSPAETANYVAHRLQVAGHDGGRLFLPSALDVIAEWSQGIPRNVNNICRNALSLGCALGRTRIDPEIIQLAAADLSLDPLIAPRQAILQPALPTPVEEPPPADLHAEKHLAERRILPRIGVIALLAVSVLLLVSSAAKRQGQNRPTTGTLALSRQSAQPAGPGIGLTMTDTQTIAPASASAFSERRTSPGSMKAAAPLVYRVVPNDTLEQISLRSLGRYDTDLLQKWQELNPELTDPDLILVGQRLRLPRPGAHTTASSGDQGHERTAERTPSKQR